ncbi:hypothetical protein C8J57DRAFT_615050 [Mycena rebaudengoi]|nr:hypothetical protein C8J57DRAFT_615050 [Mycena rebaudengoi]
MTCPRRAHAPSRRRRERAFLLYFGGVFDFESPYRLVCCFWAAHCVFFLSFFRGGRGSGLRRALSFRVSTAPVPVWARTRGMSQEAVTTFPGTRLPWCASAERGVALTLRAILPIFRRVFVLRIALFLDVYRAIFLVWMYCACARRHSLPRRTLAVWKVC